MRISSLQFFEQNLKTLNNTQAELLNLQKQVGTGVGIDQASDDPEAFITAFQAQKGITEAEQFNRNITVVRSRFSQQETILGSIGESLNSLKDLALQSRNGTLNAQDQRSLAIEFKSRLEEVRDLLKTKDFDDLPLFQTTGTESSVEIANGRSIALTFSAGEKLLGIGGTGTTAISDLDQLTNDIARLGNYIDGGPAIKLSEFDALLETANKNALSARVQTGTTLIRLDQAEELNSNLMLEGKRVMEDSVGADLTETISRLTQTDAQLKALQVSYSQISKNSLFDLLA